MGTRINYELVESEKASAVVVLYSNSSHSKLDPKAIFKSAARTAKGFSELVEALLQHRYSAAGGHHKKGDRMFWIDSFPGDRDEVLQVRYSAVGEAKIVTIKNPVDMAVR